MPDSDNRVPAELLQGRSIVRVFGDEVDVSFDRHVEQHFRRGLVNGDLSVMLGSRDLNHGSDSVNTAPQILRMAEVIERDGRITVCIFIDQAQVTS